MSSFSRYVIGFSLMLVLSACTLTADTLHNPISSARSRATPLHFGVYVTPDNGPITPPEQFIGFHAGTDYEITADELESDVPVFAICSGEIRYSGFTQGYGGLIAQHCTILKESVTVLYGHLALDTLPDLGSAVQAGNKIGLLASARSNDSGGNRKHLHLGIHRSNSSDFRGYVQSKQELADYIDPETVLPSFPLFGSTLAPYWQELE